MRQQKRYNHNGLDGCVQQTRSRITKTLVGVYHGEQSGMECDPNEKWVTVCEEHNTIATHSSLAKAREFAPDPSMWCDECRDTNCASCAAPMQRITRGADGKEGFECSRCGRFEEVKL